MSFEGSFGSARFRLGAGRIAQGLLVAAFIGAPVAAYAAPSTEDLDQRIKILERQLEIQKEEAETKAKDASTASVGDKGLSVKKGDFEIGGPGWGALEVAARYGKLEIDDEAFDTIAVDAVTVASFASATSNASEADSWTLGFNWYLTSNVKAVVNYTQTEFEGGGGGTSAAPLDREDEKAVFGRVQLSF